MGRKQDWTAMPNCVHNTGVTCEGVSPRCKYCGWNPKEDKRRLAAIHAGALSTKDGKKYLHLTGREVNPNAVH